MVGRKRRKQLKTGIGVTGATIADSRVDCEAELVEGGDRCDWAGRLLIAEWICEAKQAECGDECGSKADKCDSKANAR